MQLQKSPEQKRGYNHSRPKSKAVSFIMATVVTLFISSGTAYAGLFSFLAPILEGPKASAQTVSVSQKSNLQTLDVLQAAANMDPNPIKLADALPIDKGEILVADIANSNQIDDSQYNTSISTYTVRDGDTVSGVAKMFNVSINTVLWANDLTSKSILRPGQNLVILPVTGISYTVQKGDTLAGIAKKFGSGSDAENIKTDILNYNDLTLASSLQVGQVIIIPDAEPFAETAVSAPATKSNTSSSKPTSSKGYACGGRFKVSSYEPLLDNICSYPSYSDYYIRPIVGGSKTQSLHGHNAVDLAAPVGTKIRASASGTVIIARSGGWNGGYGTFVVIQHPNGTQTLYAHMLRTAVSAGEKVSQGETIGYIGMTGHTTGPHVHFEIRGAQNPF